MVVSLAINFVISVGFQTSFAISVFVGYAIIMAYDLIVVIRNRNQANFDNFHIWTVATDIGAISLLIFARGVVDTELYLFYLLPLVTAAQFLPRRKAGFWGIVTVFAFLASLVGIHGTRSGNQPDAFIWFWSTRTVFLLTSLWLVRILRSLPTPSETQIVSPATAREKLEQLLSELRESVEFDTASIQILVRDKLEIVISTGFDEEVKEIVSLINFPLNDDRSPNKKVVETGHWLIIDSGSYPSFTDPANQASHIKTWMGIPICHPATEELFGLLSIDSSKPNAYDHRHAEIATWFARKAAAYMTDAALGPAALTLSTKRDALTSLIKKFVKGLPGPVRWTDDLEVVKRTAEACKNIFKVEDCSIYFLRTLIKSNSKANKVLYLVASTAIPSSEFGKYESQVSGRYGDGLTGYSVYKNKTLNYGFNEIEKSPHRGDYTQHFAHLESKRSKQVMLTPIRNSHGEPIGVLKVENKQGWPLSSRFPYMEQNLFEAYAQVVGQIIEEVRERNYIRRQRTSIHNLRSVLRESVVKPLNDLIRDDFLITEHPHEFRLEMENIQKAVTFTTSIVDRFLMDPSESMILENEGLIPALQSFVSYLRDGVPTMAEICSRIEFVQTDARDNLPFKVRVAFYNIGREAIMNVIKHSKIDWLEEGKAEVTFDQCDGGYFLTVKDNGEGFLKKSPLVNHTTFGLEDVHDQIRTIAEISAFADVQMESLPGKGTEVKVIWIPVKKGR